MTMITLSQCLDFTGLASDEMFLGASLAPRHHALLLSYLLNLDRGAIAVREMIIADLRSFLDVGARLRAADALLVLRLFLFDHPHALLAESAPVQGGDKVGHGSAGVMLVRAE